MIKTCQKDTKAKLKGGDPTSQIRDNSVLK